MSILSDSVKRRRSHAGPRNMHAICMTHKEEHGERPDTTGLSGQDRTQALHAQKEWDAGLMRRSPIIAQSINNGRACISKTGFIVPK